MLCQPIHYHLDRKLVRLASICIGIIILHPNSVISLGTCQFDHTIIGETPALLGNTSTYHQMDLHTVRYYKTPCITSNQPPEGWGECCLLAGLIQLIRQIRTYRQALRRGRGSRSQPWRVFGRFPAHAPWP